MRGYRRRWWREQLHVRGDAQPFSGPQDHHRFRVFRCSEQLNEAGAIHRRSVRLSLCSHNQRKAALVRYTGFEKQHRIMGFAIIGFFKKALEISGAQEVNIYFSTPIEDGKAFCELSIAWD